MGTEVRMGTAGRTRGIVLALVVAALLTGCASLRAPAGPDASAPPAVAADVPPQEWPESAATVTALEPGADDRTVVVRTTVPVAPGCAGEPRVSAVVVENDVVHVTVVVPVSPANDEFGGPCSEGEAVGRAELVLDAPLGDRAIAVNSGLDGSWESDGAGGYAPCDPYLGCGDPPAEPCDGYLGRYLAFLDVPRHTSQGVVGCADPWLVYVLDPAASFCGPGDGETSCDVESQRRYELLRFDPAVPAWVRVGASAVGGTCADALATAPADAPPPPADLCAGEA